MSVEGPRYPIESVDNALRLLALFRTAKSVRVSEASKRLGCAVSTAHRLLSMLQHHGFIEQDPLTRSYVPGKALIEIGLEAAEGLDIRGHVRPYLARISRETGETSSLVVLRGANVMFLDGVESPHVLRAGTRLRETLPAHATASGKVLLARLSRAELRRIYPEDRLPALTPHTLTSRAELERELDAIRRRGFAVSPEESDAGLNAVARAFSDSNGAVRGALAVVGPASRFGRAQFPAAAESLARAARDLKATLS